MGALCSCLDGPKNAEATPILSGQQNSQVASRRVPSYLNEGNQNQAVVTQQAFPKSARLHPTPDKTNEKEVTPLDRVESVSVHQLPPLLPALNKTFQDHAKLYNDLYKNFQELRQSVNYFRDKFSTDTAEVPSMANCLRVLSARCGGAELKVRRVKHCIQLEYDRREVSEKCTGLPEDTLELLELYNRINYLTKSILDRAPQVNRSLHIVLDDEHNLQKEVTKSDLSTSEGPEALRHCIENINRLGKLPGFIEIIQKYTDKIFKEIVEGSKNLLPEA